LIPEFVFCIYFDQEDETHGGSPEPVKVGFTAAVTGYSSNVLSADYATPADIPGLFKLDNPSDDGRVVLAAMKYNSKVIAVGMVYNYRTSYETNPATGMAFNPDGLYNTGNFILFEK